MRYASLFPLVLYRNLLHLPIQPHWELKYCLKTVLARKLFHIWSRTDSVQQWGMQMFSPFRFPSSICHNFWLHYDNSTRVSNEIGGGNILKAKNAVAVTLKLSCFLALIVLLFLAAGHNIWAGFFTNNPIIVQEFASMTPLLCISILLDSAQGVLSGIVAFCLLVKFQHEQSTFKIYRIAERHRLTWISRIAQHDCITILHGYLLK